MSTILDAVWAFILAHPTEDTAVLGALFTFVFSLFQKAIVSSPRVAAFYSLLCRAFPDASDPKALAADVVMLFTGKPKIPESGPKSAARLGKVLPMAVLALALSLTGCKVFSSPAVIVDEAKVTACALPKLAMGETPEQVSVECAGATLELVIAIAEAELSAQKIRAARFPAGSLNCAPAPAASR